MELIAHQRRPGRRGPDAAALLAAALASDAERIELDALASGGRLLVAHDEAAIRRGAVLGFEDALSLVAKAGRGLLADVKNAAAARPLAEAIAAAGYGARTIVSGALADADVVGRGCGARRAWTLPGERGCDPPAHAGPLGLATRAARDRVRAAAVAAIAAGRCDAVAVDARFAGGELVAAVHAAGGGVLVWTVDRPAALRRFAALGADGLVTDDPAAARLALRPPG